MATATAAMVAATMVPSTRANRLTGMTNDSTWCRTVKVFHSKYMDLGPFYIFPIFSGLTEAYNSQIFNIL